MPLCNRVSPFGVFEAVESRGLFLGNRGGRLHDPATRRLGPRRFVSPRWIVCLLAFKGRRRRVWGDGYTELFFLDEVTALAAGHRPCAECRREAAAAFRQAMTAAAGDLSLDAVDRLLHQSRIEGRGRHAWQRRHSGRLEDLPDGTMIEADGLAFALRGSRLLHWSPEGYRQAGARSTGEVTVLTPQPTVAALAAGFRPVWHPTAE
jgi:hypothetical protein